MRRLFPAVGLGLVILLGGCQAGNQALVKPCCYSGDVALVRISELDLILRDGQILAFAKAFPGFRPSSGAFALRLPFDKPISIQRIDYAPLLNVLPQYDLNGDLRLDDPELTVFYVKEAARGFGHDVVDVVADGRVVAVQTSAADIGGLVGYVSSNRSHLDPDTWLMFTVLGFESDVQRREREVDGADVRVQKLPM